MKSKKLTLYTILLTTAISVCIAFLSPGVATGIFFSVLALYGAFRKPEWLLLLLIAYLPFEPFLLKFVSDELYVFARYGSEVIIYLLFITFFIKRITNYDLQFMNEDKNESGSIIHNSKFIILKNPFKVLIFLIGVLFLIGVISLFINSVPFDVGVFGLRQIFRFVLLFFIVLLLFPSYKFQRKFFGILFAIVLIQSVLGISQALSGGRLDSFLLPGDRKVIGSLQLTSGTKQFWEEGRRVFGTMGRYDQLGSFLVVTLLMLIAFLYEYKRLTTHDSRFTNEKSQISNSKIQIHSNDQNSNRLNQNSISNFKLLVTSYWLPVTASVGIITLILTYSRASWIAFLVGLCVIAIGIKRDKKIIFGFLIAFFCAVILFFSSGKINQYLIDSPNQTLTERAFEVLSPSRWMGEYYGLGRMYFIVNTPPALISYAPLAGLVGVGPGTFGGGAVAALQYTQSYSLLHLPFGIWGTEGHIDNNWFSLMGEIGFLGVACYWLLFGLLGYYSYTLYKNGSDVWNRSLGLGYCGVLTAVFVLGFFAMYLEMRTLAPYVWILGGLVITNYKLRITNEKI